MAAMQVIALPAAGSPTAVSSQDLLMAYFSIGAPSTSSLGAFALNLIAFKTPKYLVLYGDAVNQSK